MGVDTYLARRRIAGYGFLRGAGVLGLWRRGWWLRRLFLPRMYREKGWLAFFLAFNTGFAKLGHRHGAQCSCSSLLY